MKALLFKGVFFTSFLVFSVNLLAKSSDDETVIRRVQAHLAIGDCDSACYESYFGLQSNLNSKPLWITYLKSLARARDEKTLMNNWRLFVQKFPGAASDREILECLSWTIIENGANSSSPAIRVISLLGAFFSQDAKGVALLQKGLRDNNSFLRAAALKLSSQMQDALLQDEVLRLFKTETVWNVRLEAIRALGQYSMQGAKDDLSLIIAEQHTSAEEKAAAIDALVEMSDQLPRDQIELFSKSCRAGLRLLACTHIAHFDQIDTADLLVPLVDDHHPEVRAKALEVLGRLRVLSIGGQSVLGYAEGRIKDPDYVVAITAAWVTILLDPLKGALAFEPFLSHDNPEVRHLAAAALAASGRYGVPLSLKVFRRSSDPYVRMNLAIGLIGQREMTMAAADCLYEALSSEKERWMWSEVGSFRILSPSTVKHDETIPNCPEAINQLVRLNVLEILAIVHHPKAYDAVKKFLQEGSWGISGMASALLLTEGDEEAVDVVKALLQDKDSKVRTQAALILALWGKGDEAVSLLQEVYPTADKELKGQILEAIGRVGSAISLPFLVDKLEEPHQTLRIVAAAALLECLYH